MQFIITTAKARVVPDGLAGAMKPVVSVEVTGRAKGLETTLSTALTEDEMAIWKSLVQAVSERLDREIRS